MRILVLGGSRFVGLHAVFALLGTGHEVVTLNRGTRNQPEGVSNIKCDRKDLAALRRSLKDQSFDGVMDISNEDPRDTETIISLFRGRIDRFVHCSTGAVYEDRWEFPVYEDGPLTSWAGGANYPEDKAQCERILLEAHQKDGFPCVILRPTVIYGPDNYVYREGYVFDRAEARRAIPVPGNGKSVTHVVHVDDVADAFLASLTSKGSVGEAYNIAGPRAVTLDLWVESASKPVLDKPKIVHYDPAKVGRTVATGFPLSTNPWVMSIEKARRDLNFRPRDLFAGMKETYDWYLQHHPFGKPDFLFDRSLGGLLGSSS